MISFNPVIIDDSNRLRLAQDFQFDENGNQIGVDTLLADTLGFDDSFGAYMVDYSHGIFTLAATSFVPNSNPPEYKITVVRREGEQITVSNAWSVYAGDDGFIFSWAATSTPDGRGIIGGFVSNTEPKIQFWGFNQDGSPTEREHIITIPDDQQVNGLAMTIADNFVYAAFTEARAEIEVPSGGAFLAGFSLDEVMDVPVSIDPVIDSYKLSAYPNPFNPSTLIEFDLIRPQNVKLEIFDITGRSVAVLLDEFRRYGTHTVQFNAENLSAGIYFAQIEAGDFVKTAKLVLLK